MKLCVKVLCLMIFKLYLQNKSIKHVFFGKYFMFLMFTSLFLTRPGRLGTGDPELDPGQVAYLDRCVSDLGLT